MKKSKKIEKMNSFHNYKYIIFCFLKLIYIYYWVFIFNIFNESSIAKSGLK